MSLGGSLMRRNTGLAVPTPIYADSNDSPIDLRKKVAIQRQRRFEYGYSDDDDDDNDNEDDAKPLSLKHRATPEPDGGLWYGGKNFPVPPTNPYLFSLRNLHPVLSEQYGIQYALFSSSKGTHVLPVPYSPFAHKSLLSDHRDNRNNEHRETPPEYCRDVYEQDQYYQATKRKAKYYLQNCDREYEFYGASPRIVTSRSSSTPSPTEQYKHHHTTAGGGYWRHKKFSPPANDNSKERFVEKSDFHVASAPKARNENTCHQSWMRVKSAIKTRLRVRSHSCSRLHRKQLGEKTKKKYHAGYGSDSEIEVNHTACKPITCEQNPVANKSFKTYRPVVTDENSSDVSPKKNYTLLNLLVGNANSIKSNDLATQRKKGIDVLLHHLQQSPANQTSRKEEYPWGVYEYYNHLVERSSRDRSANYIQQAFMEHPSLAEETSANQQRKRPSRALTGKHVKHGTGASPSTLITLRQKIQERQKAKELLLLRGQPDALGKASISRNALSKKPKLGSFKRIKQGPLPSALCQNSKLRSTH